MPRLALLALLGIAGCGQAGGGSQFSSTVPIKGKVTYKGELLTHGDVTFEPENSGREAHGSIQPDGSFTLSTFKDGDGVISGSHRVAVTGSGKNGALVVPIKYRNVGSSNVVVEVSPSKIDYVIELP
jgi:hypothetical protein